jgi:hypothetical protein
MYNIGQEAVHETWSIEFPIDNARIEEHGPGLGDGTSIGLVLPIWWARIHGLVVINVCGG